MFCGAGWIAGVEGNGSRGAPGHGVSHAELQTGRCRLDTDGRLFGFGGSAGCEQAASQQFERSRPEHAGDERQVVAAARGGEDVDGALGFAGFDECGGQCDSCCADQALIEAACEDVVLLGGGQRQVEVAGGERGE